MFNALGPMKLLPRSGSSSRRLQRFRRLGRHRSDRVAPPQRRALLHRHLRLGGDVEDLEGSPYADTLHGSSGPDLLIGGGRADVVAGHGGADALQGGPVPTL